MPDKILLIDDEEAIRDSIGDLLRREGYDVDCASDGAAAVDAVRQKVYDLVISDIRMPGIDGIELIERIRQFAPGQKVVMITGFGSLETAVRSQHRGACDYLTKPFSLRELRESIRRALRQEGAEAARDMPRLDHKLHDLAGAFSLLSEFTKSLNSSFDLAEILDATIRLLNSIGDTESSSVVLFPDRVRSISGIRQGLPNTVLARGRGVTVDLFDAGPWLDGPAVMRADDEPGNGPDGPDRAVRTLVRETMAARGFKSALFLPITVNGVTIGIADVCSARHRGFSETDRNFLSTAVNELSLAVARAFSYLDMEERAREVGLLYQLSLTLSRSLSAIDSVRAICESATDITAARGAILQTTLEPGAFRQYVFSSATGFSDSPFTDTGLAFLPDIGRQDPFVSNDPLKEGTLDAATSAAFSIGRIASVPLLSEWETLGRLAVYGVPGDRPFDERDIRLLTVFARHASEVLLNTRLFENIRESREKIIAEKKALDAAVQAMADGVMTLDRDCRITQVNESLADLVGRPKDRIIGAFCHEAFPGDDCGVCSGPSPGRTHSVRRRIKTAGGRSVGVSITFAPVCMSDGAVDGWVAVVRETGRKTETPTAPRAARGVRA